MSLIPTKSSTEAKVNYDPTKWYLFARKITKCPFVKEYLKSIHNNKCAWCGGELKDEFIVHHISYEHECVYTIEKKIDHPTEKRPNRTCKIPNCEICYINSKDKFDECMSKIAPVHKMCNWNIEKTFQACNRT